MKRLVLAFPAELNCVSLIVGVLITLYCILTKKLQRATRNISFRACIEIHHLAYLY
jgi:hypothetical protein